MFKFFRDTFALTYVLDPFESSGYEFRGPRFLAKLVVARAARRDKWLCTAPHETGLCWASAGCKRCAY